MTDQIIFQKAVEKAHKNIQNNITESLIDNWIFTYSDKNKLFKTIFNHEFAKAFWGEKTYSYIPCNECDGDGWIGSPETGVHDCKKCKCTGVFKTGKSNNKGWKYHLQQMILCKEPLKYLEKFL